MGVNEGLNTVSRKLANPKRQNRDKLYMVRESILNSNPKEIRREVVFDWDDDYHFAIVFKRGDSRLAVASKLYDAARELREWTHLM